MKIILTLSLAVNIVLIAAGLGVAARHMEREGRYKRHIEDLSPVAQNIVGRSFQAAFKEIKPLGNEARKERAELIKVLSAEEFDEDAFDASVEKLVSIQGEIMEMKVEGIRKMAAELPAEDRAKMADKIAWVVGGREHRVRRHRKPMKITPEHKPADIAE